MNCIQAVKEDKLNHRKFEPSHMPKSVGSFWLAYCTVKDPKLATTPSSVVVNKCMGRVWSYQNTKCSNHYAFEVNHSQD